MRKRGGAGLVEWGYLVLVATLVQAAVAGALLILLPLGFVTRTWPAGTGRRMGSYFFLLGLAFLFVEMAFIQKFILFLSHPLYSVAVVLAGFLVFAGLGSALSGRFVRHCGGRQARCRAARRDRHCRDRLALPGYCRRCSSGSLAWVRRPGCSSRWR